MSGRIWWISSILFAGLVAFLSFQILRSSESIIFPTNDVEVLVSASDIPARRSLVESDLIVRKLPADTLPDGAATSVEEVIGKMATVDLVADVPILLQELASTNEVTRRLALSIPDSKAIVAMPIDSNLIKAGLIRPGDLIDVAATFSVEVATGQGAVKSAETVSLLDNLEVHALIVPPQKELQENEGNGVFIEATDRLQTVLMALDQPDAVTLQHVIDVGGVVDIMLHSNDNSSTEAETVPVDGDYLAERFGIQLVRYDAFMLTKEYFLEHMDEFVFTGEQYPKPDLSEVDLSAEPGWD
ncbi:MAG: Flp pilus assembly protein CpaB [Chloroflexota bacterium]